MLINGISIDKYDAEMLDRTITPNEVVTVNDWLEGASSPTFIRQQDSFKTITVVLLVDAGDEESALMDVSNLIRISKGQVIIKFDEDISAFTYPAVLESNSVERMKPGVHQLTLTYKSGYAIGKEVAVTAPKDESQFVINYKGTAETPVIVELTTTTAAINTITFTFVDGEFTIKELDANQTYIIDSEQGSIIEKDTGKSVADKFDGFYLPKLQPGVNTIDRSWYVGYTLTIRYKPRYV
jgi:hypothetical protein